MKDNEKNENKTNETEALEVNGLHVKASTESGNVVARVYFDDEKDFNSVSFNPRGVNFIRLFTNLARMEAMEKKEQQNTEAYQKSAMQMATQTISVLKDEQLDELSEFFELNGRTLEIENIIEIIALSVAQIEEEGESVDGPKE